MGTSAPRLRRRHGIAPIVSLLNIERSRTKPATGRRLTCIEIDDLREVARRSNELFESILHELVDTGLDRGNDDVILSNKSAADFRHFAASCAGGKLVNYTRSTILKKVAQDLCA
jgi:hypothetical protein